MNALTEGTIFLLYMMGLLGLIFFLSGALGAVLFVIFTAIITGPR